MSLVPTVSLASRVSLGLDSQFFRTWKRERAPFEYKSQRQKQALQLLPQSCLSLSQWSATPCVSLNELANMGDPDLLEEEEEEGRTAGWL